MVKEYFPDYKNRSIESPTKFIKKENRSSIPKQNNYPNPMVTIDKLIINKVKTNEFDEFNSGFLLLLTKAKNKFETDPTIIEFFLLSNLQNRIDQKDIDIAIDQSNSYEEFTQIIENLVFSLSSDMFSINEKEMKVFDNILPKNDLKKQEIDYYKLIEQLNYHDSDYKSSTFNLVKEIYNNFLSIRKEIKNEGLIQILSLMKQTKIACKNKKLQEDWL